jgi:ribosomal protein S18 acetylase RimI-like enzyme
VITTYLELRDPADLRPAHVPRARGVRLDKVTAPALNRWFYETIGRDWSWTDRLGWSDEQWAAYAAEVETWVLRLAIAALGYVELRSVGGEVELAMLGILPPYRGAGLGGHLLTEAVRRAWELPGARRVWVHTCTLDGPHALPNYEARGFRVYDRVAGGGQAP